MNGSKRTISRVLAFVMLVSAMFTNVITASADVNDVSLIDSVVSSAAAVVDEIIDDDADDLAADEEELAPLLDSEQVAVMKAYAAGDAITGINGMKALGAFDFKNDNMNSKPVHGVDKDYVYAAGTTTDANALCAIGNNAENGISFTPEKDGTVKIIFKVNDNISGNVFGTDITNSTGGSAYYYREIAVKAEQTYSAYLSKSKIRIFYLGFTPDAAEETQDTTKEEETQATTDAPTGGEEEEATPTYWNFRAGQADSLAQNEYAVTLQAGTDNTTATVKGLKIDASNGAAKFNSNRDWAQINKDLIIEIPVDGPCTVSINTYSVATGFSFNDGAEVIADGNIASYIYNGEKGYVKAVCTTSTGSDYIGYIQVEPVKGSGSSFTFWFDEYMTEQGITSIPGNTKISVDGGEIEVVGPLDTEYSSAAGTYNGEEHKGYKSSTGDGGKGNGGSNKGVPTTGTAIGFTPSIDGVATLYFYAPSGKTTNVYTQNIAEDGSLSLESNIKAEPVSYTFDAKVGQKYYFDTTSTGNLSFVGIKFLINEPVTVPVTLTGADLGTANVVLTDIDTGKEYAKIAKGQSTVTVLKGHTYAVSSDDSGLEATIAEGGTEITIADENTAINVKLEELADVPVTGTITGMDASAVTSLTWTKMTNTSVYVTKTAEEAGIKADGSYGPVMLKPGDYAVTAVTTNGYTTIDHVAVAKNEGAEDEIYFVSPDVVTYETDVEIENANSALKFTGMSKHSVQYGVSGGVGATITVPVKPSQRVTVEGGYDGEFEITGKGTAANSGNSFSAIYTTVEGDDVVTITVTKVGNVAGEGSKSAYIKSIKVENIPDPVPYSDTVTIADVATVAAGDYTYPNFKEAIAAIKNMTDRGDKVVTIDVQKDLREQVKFDISNVKIKGNGHTLDWYYGLGGKYYSVGADGYYNEELAHDKFAKNSASTSFWGGVMVITGSNVSVEDYTIKNTFNYEVTDEEIADGVEFDAAGSANTKWKDSPRVKGTDVHTPTYRERALAVGLVGQNLEFYKCNILSSQDTLGYNGANTSTAYFKECTIGGNTDFICGAGAMIFDKCTLEWFMEGQTDSLGYLVAPREQGAYVFRNCEVVRGEDKYNTDPAVQGYYGRCWGGADSKAYFIDTEVNGTIKQVGWYNMNGVAPENATFIESGNTSNGEPFGPTDKGNIKNPADLSHLTDEELAAKVEPMTGDAIIESTLGGWIPEHYDEAPPVEEGPFTWTASKEVADNEILLDNENATIKAEQAMSFAENAADRPDGVTFVNGVTANAFNKTSSVNTVFNGDNNCKYRLVATITAKDKPINITIANYFGSVKPVGFIKNVEFSKNDAGEVVKTAATGEVVKTEEVQGGVFCTYDLKPGESITYGGSGTNPEVYGINITPLEVNESAASFDWYIDDLDTDKDGNVDPGTFDVEGSKIQLLPGFDADKWVVLNVADSATPGYAAFGGRAEANAYKSGTRPQKAPGYDAAKVPTSGSGVVFTPGKDGMLTVYFAGQNKTLVRDFAGGSLLVENSSADAPGSIIPQSYSINVVGGHQYAIHSSSATNNYAIAGIKFTVNEEVTVPLKWTDDGKIDYSAVNVEFVDADLGNVYATAKNGDAEVKLLKGHRYTVKSKDSGAAADVAGADTFTVIGNEVTINLTEVPDTKLSGRIIDDYDHVMADANTIITGIEFVNMSDPTRKYTGVINADGTYTVDPIKPGEYNTVITAEGYTTQDRVSVTADEAKNVNDVYVESTTPVAYPTEFKAEINVPGDYDTLTEANAAIKAMTRPEGEAGRVTIKLNKTLQEQVVFDADYVTLDGQGNELNWYYGTSGNYYSMDKDTGLYSKSLFLDKYEKSASVKDTWGRVAIIRGQHFKTVNTTYRNTFNYEVTPKEVEDGAVTVGFPDGRKLGDDVTVYAAKERSNAFYIEAANIEIDNCKILSSQDTFGINGTTDGGYSVYVKNSTIGGNTDYICGEFKAVFDNCKLEFYAYENDATHNAAVGYIVAPKTNAYVFRNCEVTTNGKEGTDPVTGLWGRTWGAGSKAYFVNCETNGHILEDGWGQMNAGDADTAVFGEYGNTSNGEPFVTHGQYAPAPEVTDEATIKSLTTDDILEFALAGWLPDIYDLAGSGDGLWGDVNADTHVDAIDVSVTLQYTLTPSLDKVAAPFYPERADVTGDGKVNSADVAAILQKVLDGNYKLPVEKDNKPVPPAEPAEKEDLPATTVWVVGDSTACHYTEIEDPLYWFKRVGFGDKLQQFLDPQATVENLALSGRSSKSFATGINENGVTDQAAVDNYNRLKSEIKAGDYLIIAWGHNDEKTDAYRQTVPAATPGDYTQEGSFEKSLYDNYIKIAQDASATPILCTPIIRANASGTLSNNDLHKPAAGDYSVPIKALGEKLGILVVDSLANTESLYTRLGAGADAKTNEEAKLPDVPTGYMTLHAALQDKAADTTHLNAFGASMVAYMMAKDIRAGSTGLEKYIGRIQEPTFNNNECRNPDWEAFDESIYNPSSIWKFGADSKWAGSVFGSSVGTFTEDNHPNCDIVLNADQSVTLMAANNKGKIASDRDGITMYFQEIDADQPFTLTATAHIDEVTDAAKKGTQEYDASNNQAGFGLMLRDNMFTDYNYDTNAHYFAVGSTAQNSGKNDVSVWRRKTMPDGSAKNMEQTVVKAYETAAEAKAALPAGSSFDLKISRDANGVVTLQRGTEDPVVFDATTGADTNLKAVKADKDYVGMFVARKGTVTFSNIKLELQ